jgi:beta-galactosidase/beta-glucuronidase
MGKSGYPKPVVPSEYSHAMGNSNGSLDRQWKYIYEYPNLQGGFIWDWIDQGLYETDSDSRMYHEGSYSRQFRSGCDSPAYASIQPTHFRLEQGESL